MRADPFVGSNVNYLKLQTLALSRFARVLFLDLDVVVVGDLSFLLAQPHELVGYRSCTAPVNSGLFVVRQGGALREAPNRSAADGPPGALCTLAVTADGPSLEEALGGEFDVP